jgi:hypothetical protein
MSSLFSDPPFPRGTTLLNNEKIDLDPAGNPIAGVEIVGQVKAFQDVTPGTGPAAIRHSNRLIYCVAARYKGANNLTAADAGKVFAFDTAAPMTEFSAVATAANVNTDGRAFGVLDEYLTVDIRPNDIVWLVVKGPATVNKTTGTAINAGAAIEVTGSAGAVTVASTGVKIGQQIRGSQAAAGDTKVRVNLFSATI